MTFINPLDFETLFVNVLSGNMMIFVALAMICIAILAAKFRMNNITLWLMFAVFGGFIGLWAPWYWAASIVIGGLAIGFLISKLIKQ